MKHLQAPNPHTWPLEATKAKTAASASLALGKLRIFFEGGKTEGFSHQKTPDSVESLSVRFCWKKQRTPHLWNLLKYCCIGWSPPQVICICVVFVTHVYIIYIHIWSNYSDLTRVPHLKGSWNLFYFTLKSRLMKFILFWPYTPLSKYMAQSPKGRFTIGLYKPIHGNCAIYFYPGVSIHNYISYIYLAFTYINEVPFTIWS